MTERRIVRRGLVALACALGLLLAYGLGTSSDGVAEQSAVRGPTPAELDRLADEAAAEARDRYAAGVTEGKSRFAPGTSAYRRIYARGVRAARKAMAARVEIQYAKGVKAGKAAAGRSYASGREAGYDAGYDDGYDAGLDEASFSSSPDDSYAEDSPDIGYDLDCADFSGPVTVSAGDPHGLDADGDGIGCE